MLEYGTSHQSRSINWPLWTGISLIPIGIAGGVWVLIYAMASTAAPPSMPVPISQYICLFGSPTAILVGLGLVVVGTVRIIRRK
jgi:hypothetical protein